MTVHELDMKDAEAATSPSVRPVIRHNGAFGCQLSTRGFVPIKISGDPVTEFAPGWVPVQVYTGFSVAVLLELRREDGLQALWYLDADLGYTGNALDAIGKDRCAQLFQELWIILVVLVRIVLCEQSQFLDDRVTGFLALGNQARAPLVAAALASSDIPRLLQVPTSTLVIVAGLADDAIRAHCAPTMARVSVRAIRAILSLSMLGLAPEAVTKGILNLPSPLDGRPMTCDAALPLTGGTVAYRFVDTTFHEVFFVVAGDLFVITIALYHPASGLCFTKDQSTAAFLEHHRPGLPIEVPFIQHILDYGELLLPYIRQPQKHFAMVFEHNHLGHHLWQDLTGAFEMTRRVSSENLPELYVINSAASEMYGRYEDLFPEYRGKVNRSCRSQDQFIRTAYQQGLCPICPTGFYVKKELGQRIVNLAEKGQEVGNDWALLRGVRRLEWPIVLIGLRVENRTIVDLQRFCARVIDYISRNSRGALFVVDGHNSAVAEGPPHVFTSHFETLAAKPPIQVERELVIALRQEFSDRNVLIHDTIGAAMSRSIFWSHHCDFFVAPWGAGLAKYRWAANKEGLILAGEAYLRHGLDMHIYIADSVMEDPTPVRVLGLEYVHDEPGASSLIPLEGESRQNFRVDFTGVEAQLAYLLSTCVARPHARNPIT